MMKLILLAVMAVLTTAAHAQQKTQNFYDSRGNVAGTARTAGTATTFIDKRGRFVGTAITAATAWRCTTGMATSPAVWCGHCRSGSGPRP